MTASLSVEGSRPGAFTPADAEARNVISGRLDDTLFVEASAGTGKTTSLVERVVNLITTGRATLNRVAAITFTEAAAAELRDRIRASLETASTDSSLGEAERERSRQGVIDLDQADICTLHAFAGGLLRERPLEAGLPPIFDTSDEIVAGIRFNEKWAEWVEQHLDGETELESHLRILLTLGLTLDQIRALARAFHDNYADLAEFASDEETSPSAARMVVEKVGELERLCGYSRLGDDDRLYAHTQAKLEVIRRLARTTEGTPAAYALLQSVLPLRQNRGTQSNWSIDPASGKNAAAVLKALLLELDGAVAMEIGQVQRTAFTALAENLRGFVLDYARQRRAEGRAEFHDLLVWAREMLRDNLAARDYFRGRYTHLLIDEAQDTDPIQAEIVMFLAEDTSHRPPAGEFGEARPTDWREVKPEPGKLFVVGDPKQSIYRFRRADTAQMELLQTLLKRAGGETVKLVQNFRSQKPVTAWVNRLFEQWMASEPSGEDDGDADDGRQATYESMSPRWNAETSDKFGPRVWTLGNETMSGSINAVRRQEAEEIGILLRQIVSEPWQMLDKAATEAANLEIYRAVNYSDVCILLPQRTGLAVLEQSLRDYRIPYRLEGSSLLFETQEIRDLLNCLRAIDDPSDRIATAAALRTPAFGCSDVDLLRHLAEGGSFDYLSEESLASEVGSPVITGLATLQEFHQARLWEPTAALIDRFIRERELMEAATGTRWMREQWRRYRYVVEQAGRFATANAGGDMLRSFLEWVDDQIDEGARVTETPTPERDEDAVRIMTVHGAKGLEFPVVILTGINSGARARVNAAVFDRQRGRVEAGVGPQTQRFATAGYEELAQQEKKLQEAENVRLMYVAATRARDHLVLSMRRPSRGNSVAGTIAEYMGKDGELWNVVGADEARFNPSEGDDGAGGGPSAAVHGAGENYGAHSVAAFEEWQEKRSGDIAEMGRPVMVAATALSQRAAEAADEGPEATEPWRRGRAGTAIGRAVHAVLQSIDLSSGEGIADKARAQAAAEGLPDHRAAEIARLAQTAVDSDIVRRAVASHRMWREVPVAAPVSVGPCWGSLHGFIDLLFEEEGSLVVVDYKTDSAPARELATVMEGYRLQGGAYAYAVNEITGKPVKEAVFLFLQPKREERIRDLPAAMAAARAAAETALRGR